MMVVNKYPRRIKVVGRMRVYMIHFLIFLCLSFLNLFALVVRIYSSLQSILIHIIPRNIIFYYFQEMKRYLVDFYEIFSEVDIENI